MSSRALAAVAIVLSLVSALTRAQHAPALRLLDGENRRLDPARDALAISLRVTNDGSLPVHNTYAATSGDARDLRVELDAPAVQSHELQVVVESVDPWARRVRDRITLAAVRGTPAEPFRSRFVRLVGDRVDAQAPGAGLTLRVALRDKVTARFESASGSASTTLRVGAAGSDSSPLAARLARLSIHVLRTEPFARPVVARDEVSALALMQEQVDAANEIWLQCGLTFGRGTEAAIEIVSPPPAALISVGDVDGLPARGDGAVSLVVDGRPTQAIATTAGARPVDTAQRIAAALRALGFSAQVTENPRARNAADASADVLVRHSDGRFVTLSAPLGGALCTDTRQSVELGVVDLSDGLTEFDNIRSQTGTLEERALIKTLADDDPGTIDVFVVNRFARATRQGEAFIASGRGPIRNAVVVDRNGLRQLPLAWTLAHELGHVLLDDPLHPDNVGPDRPWLLMDADNGRGTVNGPKRLRDEDCARVRAPRPAAETLLLAYPDPP